MTANILLIAPYSGLKELTLSLSKQYPSANIDIYEGNYANGPEIIRKLQADKHYDVIMTRGGTATACKKVTTLPIVEIQINAFDIFRILKLAEGFTGKKALLAYPNLINTFCQLKELLGYEIDTYTYIKHAKTLKILQNLNQEKYDLIIGDHIVYKTAQELGMNSMLITSGSEGIRSAIEEAIRISTVVHAYKENSSLLSSKLKKHVSVTPIDSSNDRTYSQFCQQTDGIPLNFITIEPINQLSTSDINITFPISIANKIKDYSQTPLATIISGENGMGKDAAGYLCCYYGSKKADVLIRINCFSIPFDQDYNKLQYFFSTSLKTASEVIFLEDIDKLNLDGQKKLTVILKEIIKRRNVKLIASVELSVEQCIQQQKMFRPLCSVLDEVRINLPPLKFCRSEIGNMIALYLAKLNLKSGSHIAGIKEQGRKLLINYDWPGNLHQFSRVMNHLALTKCGIYLSESDVKVVLIQEKYNFTHQELVPVDLSGTMKDIEKRIISHIMKQEGMIQSHVEKRLGIGHTTLWRKLK